MRSLFLKSILVGLILLLGAFTYSQTEEVTTPMGDIVASSEYTGPPKPLAGGPVKSTTEVISSLYRGFVDPIKSFGEKMKGSGQILLVSLIALQVLAGGVMFMAGTTDLFDLSLRGFKLLFLAGLLLAAISPQPWLGTMTGIGQSVSLAGAI